MAASHDRRSASPVVNPEEAAQCQGKSRFPSGCAAFRAANSHNGRKRKGKKAPHVRVYRCPFCGGWHFGQTIIKGRPC